MTSMTSVLTSMTLLLTPGTDYPMDCTTLRDTATFRHTKFNVESVSMATLATLPLDGTERIRAFSSTRIPEPKHTASAAV